MYFTQCNLFKVIHVHQKLKNNYFNLCQSNQTFKPLLYDTSIAEKRFYLILSYLIDYTVQKFCLCRLAKDSRYVENSESYAFIGLVLRYIAKVINYSRRQRHKC